MSRQLLRWVKRILVVTLILGLISVLPIANWMLGALWPFSRTQNAYQAFGQLEWTRPTAKTLNAMALAELALTDESLAVRLSDRPRMHPPGTLATLEYTTAGASNEALDRWRVRAIVPMLGDGGVLDAEAWGAALPDIASRLNQQGGMVLRDSGNAGLPPEAVLRFRVGESIEMPVPDDFATTDFTSGRRHHVRKRTFSLATGQVTVPVRLRVTLVEACAADVRVGEATQLEYAQFAPLPIPIGVRVHRWVQMTGCAPGATDVASPPRPADAAVDAGRTAPILRIETDGSVRVDEARLQGENRPLRYRIETVCRFDAEDDRWEVLLQSNRQTALLEVAPLPEVSGAGGPRVVASLPPIALYWLRWTEGFDGADGTALRSRHGFGSVGGRPCDDVRLRPAPAGMVPVCVPFIDRAEARFVPDPVQACAARDGP
jgi:hypothetical protein